MPIFSLPLIETWKRKKLHFGSYYTPDWLLLFVSIVREDTAGVGDRDYTDDQTSRREMREKISLDTTTSRNRTRARMITYEASGWFLFLLLTNSPSPRFFSFFSLSAVLFCCYHCCCVCSLYILYYRFFGMWCHTRWKSPHYTYNIVIEKREHTRTRIHSSEGSTNHLSHSMRNHFRLEKKQKQKRKKTSDEQTLTIDRIGLENETMKLAKRTNEALSRRYQDIRMIEEDERTVIDFLSRKRSWLANWIDASGKPSRLTVALVFPSLSLLRRCYSNSSVVMMMMMFFMCGSTYVRASACVCVYKRILEKKQRASESSKFKQKTKEEHDGLPAEPHHIIGFVNKQQRYIIKWDVQARYCASSPCMAEETRHKHISTNDQSH